VLVEVAISKALQEKKVPELIAVLTDRLASLQSGKTMAMYKALTYDVRINDQSQTFWNPYTQLIAQRNQCVHKWAKCTKAAARRGLDAAKAFVEHVATHNTMKWE
jgi:hypothetical protein